MERRKFLLGLGAASAAGVAGIGTGAFDTVEANRDASVELADDADAYLGLQSESEYAVETDGTLELDFTGSNQTDSGGEHFNFNATTEIDDVFSAVNQGAQTDVQVGLDPQEQQFDGDVIVEVIEFGPITIVFSTEDEVASFNFVPENPAVIDPGESVEFGIVVDHYVEAGDVEEGNQLDDVIEDDFTLEVTAEETTSGQTQGATTRSSSGPDIDALYEAYPDDHAQRLEQRIQDNYYK